jgi:hypothetical protein
LGSVSITVTIGGGLSSLSSIPSIFEIFETSAM